MALQSNPEPATQLHAASQAPVVPAGKLPQFHAVGFSGHRHLADPAGTARAIRGALDALRAQVPGEWIAFSSIARGGDQLFVQQARAIGLSWHAILPLSHAEFATDFTPDEWSVVEETLATADHLKVITENGDRKDAYLDCGIETVNGSDVLIAVWDGDSARGKGGTAEVVEYAKTIGKPVMIIDAITHEMRKENWDRLEPNDAVLDDLNGLPEAASAWAVNPFKAPDAVFLFQQKCDYHATHGAPGFRRLIVSTVVAHVVATVIGAAVVGYGLHLLALAMARTVVHHLRPRCSASCCAARCTRTTAGCAAGSRRSSVDRRWPPGDCREPLRCCTTSTSQAHAAWHARCTSCTRARPRRGPCRSRSSSEFTWRNESTTSWPTTTGR